MEPKEGRLVLEIEYECENEGRWIAEITSAPGVMVYGVTRTDAILKALDLYWRVLDEEAMQS